MWTTKIIAAQERYHEVRNHKAHSPYNSSIFSKDKNQVSFSKDNFEDEEDEELIEKSKYCDKHKNIYESPKSVIQKHTMHIIGAIAENQEIEMKNEIDEEEDDDENNYNKIDKGLNEKSEEDDDDDSESSQVRKEKRKYRNRSKQRGSEIGLLDDEDGAITKKRIASKKRNKNPNGDNICLFKGCGAFKSRQSQHSRSSERLPFYYNNNLTADTVDSFSVMRFDIHERRAAVHEDSMLLPPSLNALVSQNMPAYTTNIKVVKKPENSHMPKLQQHSASFKHPQHYKRKVLPQANIIKSNIDLSNKFFDFDGDENEDLKHNFNVQAHDTCNLLDVPDTNIIHNTNQPLNVQPTLSEEKKKTDDLDLMKQQLRSTHSVPLSSSLPRPRPTKQPSPLASSEFTPVHNKTIQNNISSEAFKSASKLLTKIPDRAVPVDELISIESFDMPFQTANNSNFLNTFSNNLSCNKALSANQLDYHDETFEKHILKPNESFKINTQDRSKDMSDSSHVDISEYDPLNQYSSSETSNTIKQPIKNKNLEIPSKNISFSHHNLPLLPPPPQPNHANSLMRISSTKQPQDYLKTHKSAIDNLKNQRSSSLRCRPRPARNS